MEVDAIKGALEVINAKQTVQGENLSTLLILIKGSVDLGINGMIEDTKHLRNQLHNVSQDVASLKHWRSEVVDGKGKITITLSSLFTRVMATIGTIGTIVGIVIGIKSLIG